MKRGQAVAIESKELVDQERKPCPRPRPATARNQRRETDEDCTASVGLGFCCRQSALLRASSTAKQGGPCRAAERPEQTTTHALGTARRPAASRPFHAPFFLIEKTNTCTPEFASFILVQLYAAQLNTIPTPIHAEMQKRCQFQTCRDCRADPCQSLQPLGQQHLASLTACASDHGWLAAAQGNHGRALCPASLGLLFAVTAAELNKRQDDEVEAGCARVVPCNADPARRVRHGLSPVSCFPLDNHTGGSWFARQWALQVVSVELAGPNSASI